VDFASNSLAKRLGEMMNTVLLVLAVLSVGAVAIAAYVFMVAARNYVSEAPSDRQKTDDVQVDETDAPDYVVRSAKDRRQISNVIDFPMTLSSGEVVFRDRRLSERRTVG